MDHVAFVGVGSNIDAFKNLLHGIRQIAEDGRVELIALSSFYRTSPMSPIPQDDFLNGVIKIGWRGTPLELLSLLESIEKKMGRKRDIPLGPRTLDLDILLFDDVAVDTPVLTVPHPHLHERKFVLVPCLEIDANLVHPVSKIPFTQSLAALGDEQKIALFKAVTTEEIVGEFRQ